MLGYSKRIPIIVRDILKISGTELFPGRWVCTAQISEVDCLIVSG